MSARAPSLADGGSLLQIHLLGEFRLWAGGAAIDLSTWRLRKSHALVKLLALAPDHRLQREQLLEALWPALSPEAAGNNLYYTVHVARRVLPAGTLRQQRGTVSLVNPGGVHVDALDFEDAARAALASATASGNHNPHALEAAATLYTGDLLPDDRYEDWAAEPRERLRELYFTLLLHLATHYERAGTPTLAAERLERILATDASHETAYGALIRLHVSTGNVAEARRRYEQLATLLRRELHAEPEPALRRLVESLGNADTHRAPPQHNLPAPLTRFVGREREVGRVQRALSRSRLVSLTGTGGAGKTRLALEAAAPLLSAFPGGIWLAELSAITDAVYVRSAVAAALGVARTSAPLEDALIHRLASTAGPVLLVLDNCEHVLPGCIELATLLLARCPSLGILATSRRSLGVAGELVLRIPPLTEAEAERLFEDRARLRAPSFRLTPQNTEWVTQIVRGLDGLPLAIELAAARVGTLSPREIVERLDETRGTREGRGERDGAHGRFTLLTTGNAGAPARHRSLGALLTWSYDALSESERRLFRRLSLFAGGWTLDAASKVCGDGRDVALPLASLVEHSLVTVGGDAGNPAETRYTMLETLRAYGALRLEREESVADQERLHLRHASYYAEHIALLKEQLGPEGVDRLFAAIQRELDNLRAALRWVIEHNEVHVGLRLVTQLSHYWHARGSPAEGLSWGEAVLGLVEDHADQASQSRHAPDLYVLALESVASLARIVGVFDKARTYQEQYLALRRARGEPRAVAAASVWLATIAEVQGDRAAARAALDECLEIARELEDERVAAWALQSLAKMAHAEGRLEEAISHLERWLAQLRLPEEREASASGLVHLGIVRFCLGDWAGARRDFDELLAIGREFSNARVIADGLLYGGWLDYVAGEREHGAAQIREALTLLRPLGLKPQLLRALEQLGVVAYDAGHLDRAAHLLGAAEKLRDEMPPNVTPQSLTRAVGEPRRPPERAILAAQGWAAAWATGSTLTPDEAISLALSG